MSMYYPKKIVVAVTVLTSTLKMGDKIKAMYEQPRTTCCAPSHPSPDQNDLHSCCLKSSKALGKAAAVLLSFV